MLGDTQGSSVLGYSHVGLSRHTQVSFLRELTIKGSLCLNLFADAPVQLGAHSLELVPSCAEHWIEGDSEVRSKASRPTPSLPYRLSFCPERCCRHWNCLPLKTALLTSFRSRSEEYRALGRSEQRWEAPFRFLLWKPHFFPQSPSLLRSTSGLKWVFTSDGFHTAKAMVNKFAMLLSF